MDLQDPQVLSSFAPTTPPPQPPTFNVRDYICSCDIGFFSPRERVRECVSAQGGEQ